jgi:tetratricopeptide (TPR) repeat protein
LSCDHFGLDAPLSPPDRPEQPSGALARAIELDGTDAFGYALRRLAVMVSHQFDRYPAALADARYAHELNPNDPNVLRVLAMLEAGSDDGERAIEHRHQALRLSPRPSRSHELRQLLAYASFVAKRHTEGIGWALRALNDMPLFMPTHANLMMCLVGAGEIDEAKAAFAAGQQPALAFFGVRLDGVSVSARPEDSIRHQLLFRIAAGLEDPGAEEALR